MYDVATAALVSLSIKTRDYEGKKKDKEPSVVGVVVTSLHRLTRGLEFELWECSLPLG